jgi:hypothetical protein
MAFGIMAVCTLPWQVCTCRMLSVVVGLKGSNTKTTSSVSLSSGGYFRFKNKTTQREKRAKGHI